MDSRDRHGLHAVGEAPRQVAWLFSGGFNARQADERDASLPDALARLSGDEVLIREARSVHAAPTRPAWVFTDDTEADGAIGWIAIDCEGEHDAPVATVFTWLTGMAGGEPSAAEGREIWKIINQALELHEMLPEVYDFIQPSGSSLDLFCAETSVLFDLLDAPDDISRYRATRSLPGTASRDDLAALEHAAYALDDSTPLGLAVKSVFDFFARLYRYESGVVVPSPEQWMLASQWELEYPSTNLTRLHRVARWWLAHPDGPAWAQPASRRSETA